jgi:hypothetical protein
VLFVDTFSGTLRDQLATVHALLAVADLVGRDLFQLGHHAAGEEFSLALACERSERERWSAAFCRQSQDSELPNGKTYAMVYVAATASF